MPLVCRSRWRCCCGQSVQPPVHTIRRAANDTLEPKRTCKEGNAANPTRSSPQTVAASLLLLPPASSHACTHAQATQGTGRTRTLQCRSRWWPVRLRRGRRRSGKRPCLGSTLCGSANGSWVSAQCSRARSRGARRERSGDTATGAVGRETSRPTRSCTCARMGHPQPADWETVHDQPRLIPFLHRNNSHVRVPGTDRPQQEPSRPCGHTKAALWCTSDRVTGAEL